MFRSFSFLMLLISPAFAQQQSPEVRALSSRVIGEVNANIQCSVANNQLQDKLAAAEAEVKRLTDKYEPKPAADK